MNWVKRLPIIRHVRCLYLWWRVERHYAAWAKVGALPLRRESDYKVLAAIWRGEE